ncbi:MAG: succinate dehydrogenase, hydrophobic membrane anchor protein [Sneathiella sp.]|nr:succinate dehydrogenase, hydrophobic membrane anchor protein [Sneathiella sp.]
MQTLFKRTQGLGYVNAGTKQFWIQRLTAIATVSLAIFLVVLLLALAGADYEATRSEIANPLVAVSLVLLILSGVWHMCIGMQTIIEDYLHRPGVKIMALILNVLFSGTIAVSCLWAVLKISFSARPLQ